MQLAVRTLSFRNGNRFCEKKWMTDPQIRRIATIVALIMMRPWRRVIQEPIQRLHSRSSKSNFALCTKRTTFTLLSIRMSNLEFRAEKKTKCRHVQRSWAGPGFATVERVLHSFAQITEGSDMSEWTSVAAILQNPQVKKKEFPVEVASRLLQFQEGVSPGLELSFSELRSAD